MKLFSKQIMGLAAVALIAIGGTGAAFADSVRFTVQNSYGATISLDSATCSAGSISAPSSISNGSSATFTGSATGSLVCTVRYQNGSNGCQFQVQAGAGSGFATTNAYKGTGGRPICTKLSEGAISGGWMGSFRMQ